MLIPLRALSWGYKRERAKTIRQVYALQDKEKRKRNLEEVIKIGDEKLRKLDHKWFDFPIPKGIDTNLHDLKFDSPLTLSSFKNEIDIVDRWMDLGLGGICTKTMKHVYSPGNDEPRIQEVTVDGLECFINAMGFPGEGVRDKAIQIQKSGILQKGKNIGFSIGGSTLDEYKVVFNYLNRFIFDNEATNTYFEIDISCPNTDDGQNMAKNPVLLEELLYHMRSRNKDSVIGVKLSPDMSNEDLRKLAYIVSRVPKSYINLGNTTLRTCEEVGLPKEAISIGKGGLSGPALYKRTLEMVQHIRQYFTKEQLPIIATGGIDSANKVIQLLDAGANLIGMATAVVKDMYCIPIINKELAKRRRN